MHRFYIGQGNIEYKIDIENYKLIIGNNEEQKFQIMNNLRCCFSKIQNSEFAIEKNEKRIYQYDEKPIDYKNWKYFEINPFFDLENDFKMGTKSLISKYLESYSDALEQSDIFNTIKILFESINEEFFNSECSLNIADKEIKLQIGDLTKALIFKEAIPSIFQNECSCNCGDINYEEIMLLQLKLIRKIVEKTKDKMICIVMYSPFITRKLESEILGFRYINAYLLVFTNKYYDVGMENIYICDKKSIDLSNESAINDLLMEMPFHMEREEFISSIKKVLENKNSHEFDRLKFEIFS